MLKSGGIAAHAKEKVCERERMKRDRRRQKATRGPVTKSPFLWEEGLDITLDTCRFDLELIITSQKGEKDVYFR